MISHWTTQWHQETQLQSESGLRFLKKKNHCVGMVISLFIVKWWVTTSMITNRCHSIVPGVLFNEKPLKCICINHQVHLLKQPENACSTPSFNTNKRKSQYQNTNTKRKGNLCIISSNEKKIFPLKITLFICKKRNVQKNQS